MYTIIHPNSNHNCTVRVHAEVSRCVCFLQSLWCYWIFKTLAPEQKHGGPGPQGSPGDQRLSQPEGGSNKVALLCSLYQLTHIGRDPCLQILTMADFENGVWQQKSCGSTREEHLPSSGHQTLKQTFLILMRRSRTDLWLLLCLCVWTCLVERASSHEHSRKLSF